MLLLRPRFWAFSENSCHTKTHLLLPFSVLRLYVILLGFLTFFLEVGALKTLIPSCHVIAFPPQRNWPCSPVKFRFPFQTPVTTTKIPYLDHLCFKQAQPKIWAIRTRVKGQTKLPLQSWKLTFSSRTIFLGNLFCNNVFWVFQINLTNQLR